MGVLCEFAREEWDGTLVAKRSEFHPESNAVGLYWRLTGIGREQMEAWDSRQDSRWYLESIGLVGLLCPAIRLGMSLDRSGWYDA
jgi:hypothetical protein